MVRRIGTNEAHLCSAPSVPQLAAMCSKDMHCGIFARSASQTPIYCVPNVPDLNSDCSANSVVRCSSNDYEPRWVFSLEKDGEGQGCVYNCEPKVPGPTTGPIIDPWPPALECEGPNMGCTGNTKCEPNYYYKPDSSAGYQSVYSVCKPTSPMSRDDCNSADASQYVACPKDYEAKHYFQNPKDCYFACQKKSDDGLNLVMIIAIIAAVVGVLLLLFAIMHRNK